MRCQSCLQSCTPADVTKLLIHFSLRKRQRLKPPLFRQIFGTAEAVPYKDLPIRPRL
jgi:hypothetical protein